MSGTSVQHIAAHSAIPKWHLLQQLPHLQPAVPVQHITRSVTHKPRVLCSLHCVTKQPHHRNRQPHHTCSVISGLPGPALSGSGPREKHLGLGHTPPLCPSPQGSASATGRDPTAQSGERSVRARRCARGSRSTRRPGAPGPGTCAASLAPPPPCHVPPRPGPASAGGYALQTLARCSEISSAPVWTGRAGAIAGLVGSGRGAGMGGSVMESAEAASLAVTVAPSLAVSKNASIAAPVAASLAVTGTPPLAGTGVTTGAMSPPPSSPPPPPPSPAGRSFGGLGSGSGGVRSLPPSRPGRRGVGGCTGLLGGGRVKGSAGADGGGDSRGAVAVSLAWADGGIPGTRESVSRRSWMGSAVESRAAERSDTAPMPARRERPLVTLRGSCGEEMCHASCRQQARASPSQPP